MTAAGPDGAAAPTPPVADDAPGSRIAVIRLAALLAVPVLLINGYYFGLNNHLSRLPLVLRALDPAWAAGDFYVDAASSFSVRMVFTQVIAGLAGIVPLPALYLGLAWLAIAATLAVTGLCAADLFASRRAAAVAIVIAAAVNDQRHLLSSDLAWALACGATWCALRMRPALGSALAAIAGLLHPGVGLVTGALVLITTGLAAPTAAPGNDPNERPRLRLAVAWLAGAAVLAGTLAYWRGPYRPLLPDDEFVRIFGAFRNPHHVLASTIGLRALAALAASVAAYAASWLWWQRAGGDRRVGARFACLGAGLAALLVGGVVFVELMPTRAWAVAQPFRFVRLVHWAGQLLVAATAARLAASRQGLGRALGRCFPLAAIGSALLAALHGAAALVRGGGRWPARRRAAAAVALVALALAWHVTDRPEPTLEKLVKLAVAAAMVACLLRERTIERRRAAAAAVVVVAVVGVAVAAGSATTPGAPRWLAERLPIYSLDQLRRSGVAIDRDGSGRLTPDAAAVAAAMRRLVPPGSVVLAPPDAAVLRLLSERALVVDYKCYPHQDGALVEWYRRLQACYGPTTGGGFTALAEMSDNYARLTDRRRAELARRYRAGYAVIPAGTPTSAPVLFANGSFALVDLRPGPVPTP